MLQLAFGLVAIVFFYVALKWLLLWPYYLGVHVAVGNGNRADSTSAFMLGWIFQSIYIAAFVSFIVFWLQATRDEPKVNIWHVWGTFFGTMAVVTGSAYLAR